MHACWEAITLRAMVTLVSALGVWVMIDAGAARRAGNVAGQLTGLDGRKMMRQKQQRRSTRTPKRQSPADEDTVPMGAVCRVDPMGSVILEFGPHRLAARFETPRRQGQCHPVTWCDGHANSCVTASALTSSRGWFRWL